MQNFVSIKDIKVTHEREQLLTRYKNTVTDKQSMNNKNESCVFQVINVRTFRITSISYIFSTISYYMESVLKLISLVDTMTLSTVPYSI